VIEHGRLVSIEFTLTRDDGSTADTNVGGEPLFYTHGEGEILEALEEALAGLGVGDEKRVRIPAEQGYGPVDPDAFNQLDLDAIPEEARHVGAMLMAEDPEGNQRPVRVHEVRADGVVLDFNHPLAGETLNFAVRIVAID
jgi:FKBP-type peptidyl-prolyl cis-trans isomerase 2